MFKQLFSFFMVAMLGFSFATHTANAQDVSGALERIDQIIAEMQSLRAELVALVSSTSVTTPTPAVQGSQAGSTLGTDLAYGSTNDDIKKIQTLLATDSDIYPYGVSSGFFGPKTQEAIKLFQSRFNLDPVGVVGPSTRALLEVFFAAYPAGNYPEDVLKKSVPAPVVAGASTTQTPVTTPVISSSNVVRSITLSNDDDEYIVRSYQTNGTRNRDIILYPEDGDDLIELIAKKLGASESEVRSLIDEDDLDFDSKKSSNNSDENDAEDAIEDADKAIDKARDEIKEADDDGDDIDDADELYDEARELYNEARDALDDEEYDEAVELAEEAEDLAEEAVDEIGGGGNNSDDIDVIEVDIKEGEARVKVEYDNGDDEKFTVEDEDEEDIIEEIADELDMDEDDIEDLVEFDYGDLDKITTSLNGSTFLVRVYFESDVDVKFTFDEDEDEDDIIEEIADSLNLNEDDVEKELDLDV